MSLKLKIPNDPCSLLIKISPLFIRALIDSGSACTLLDRKIYDQLKYKPKIETKYLNLTTANGSRLHVFGSTKISFQIGEDIYEQNFIIAKNLSRNAILGRDFLQKFKADILYSTKQIKIGDSFYHLDDDQHIATITRTCNEIVLKPKTMNFIKVKTKSNPYIKDNTSNLLFLPSRKGYMSDLPFVTVSPSINNLNKKNMTVNNQREVF